MTCGGVARWGLWILVVATASVTVAQGPADLRVELRSATGSNRFRVGEVIPVEAAISSSAPNKYLQPCDLLFVRHFGFPQCRFFNRWNFSIVEQSAIFVDIEKDFPEFSGTSGGPIFEVPNRDLTSTPAVYSYHLTKRFRFDQPGKFRVRLSMTIGLDDESTRLNRDPASKPHSVEVASDLDLEVVPASAEWQAEMIRDGEKAYLGDPPAARNPLGSDSPSAEELRYERATEGLCYLGTAEAARALARLMLAKEFGLEYCLDHSPSAGEALVEMQRLLVLPDAAIGPGFFQELAKLQTRANNKALTVGFISQEVVDRERELLLAALPQKRGEAEVTSLLTVLKNPGRVTSFDGGRSIDLPFAPETIAAAVANYHKFPAASQEWLLGAGWGSVRSPLMTHLVKRLAEKGSGQALLRWMELEPTSTEQFVREEVVWPAPRFSSYYLRLPDASLPGQEKQIAANFVKLREEQELAGSASLLHRYATGAALGTVLPFIDAGLSTWPCSVDVPVLAYLLKVSPGEAAPRIEQVFRHANQPPCNSASLFTDVGTLEPSPVLERLAKVEVEREGPLASDAVGYLRKHASAETKAFVWEQLEKQKKKFVAGGAAMRLKEGKQTVADISLNNLVFELTLTLYGAQGWMLSSQDVERLRKLLGEQAVSDLACRFACGANIGVSAGKYQIYGRSNGDSGMMNRPAPMEYLNPTESLYYTINQYRCEDLRALKEKITQFPVGAQFSVAEDFAESGQPWVGEIEAFVRGRGYGVGGQ